MAVPLRLIHWENPVGADPRLLAATAPGEDAVAAAKLTLRAALLRLPCLLPAAAGAQLPAAPAAAEPVAQHRAARLQLQLESR